MRIWTHITIPTVRQSTAQLWLWSLATRLALVLIAVFVLGFSVPLAIAEQQSQPGQPGAPATDVSNIPKSITDTLERVRMRDARNEAGQKTAEKEDTCLLPPLALVRSPMVTSTGLRVPAKAKKEYREACAALKEKKIDSAEKHLRKAVQEYPQYSAAWVTLGQMLAAQSHSDEARNACSQGSTVEATYVPAYLCLADLAAREKAWDEVLKLSRRALELDPSTNPIAYEYNAAANLRINKLDDAEKSALRALEIDKNNSEPRVHFVLAQIYEAKGDRANEAAQLREYLKFANNPDDVAMVKQYLSQLEAGLAP